MDECWTVSKKLGRSRQGVINLAQDKRLRAVKTGAGWVYDPQSVVDFLEREGFAGGRKVKVIFYPRVSTRGQADKGYSLRQQLEALRDHAAQEDYEVLAEVEDTISGSTLERPGLDRVRDLVVAGGVGVVLAQDRDRLAREPAYLYFLRQEFAEYGTKIRALNDRGDDSPEGELTDGIIEQIAKYERAKITQRTKRGKRRKALEGKIIAHHHLPYGLSCNSDRTNFVPDAATMPVVRRIFRMVGKEGYSIDATKKTFDAERIPAPGVSAFWEPVTIRRILTNDIYKPHTVEKLRGLVSSTVLDSLDPTKRYGLWYFGKSKVTQRRKSRNTQDGVPRTNASLKPRKFETVPHDERIAIPVPLEGVDIPREWVESARTYLETTHRWRGMPGGRYYELRGYVHCGACGGRMTSYHNNGYYYYQCIKRRNHGTKACPESVNMNAARLEQKVMRNVSALLKDPERITRQLDEATARETATLRTLKLRRRCGCGRSRTATGSGPCFKRCTLTTW
jgi:site-specific DNA recombinase